MLDPAKPMCLTITKKIKIGVEKRDNKHMDPPPSDTESSSKVSDDRSMAQGDTRRQNKKKAKKNLFFAAMAGTLKTRNPLPYLSTFSDNKNEYTTLEENSDTESSDCDHGHRHCTYHNGDGLQVILLLYTRTQRTVNYKTYQIENKLSKYDYTVSKNISKMSKRKRTPMKPNTFNPFDPISII